MFLFRLIIPELDALGQVLAEWRAGGVEPGEASTLLGKQGNFKVAAERPGGK